MRDHRIYNLFNFFFGLVWFINGLVCKVLNVVPRHQQIVEAILGDDASREITVAIGLAEMMMAFWIWSGCYRKISSYLQVLVIAAMNFLEFILAPELLLWGRANAIFALLYILLIFLNEFCLPIKKTQIT